MEKITLTDLQKRKLNKFYIAVYVVTKNIKICKCQVIFPQKLES